MAKETCTSVSCKHTGTLGIHCAVQTCPNYFAICPVHNRR